MLGRLRDARWTELITQNLAQNAPVLAANQRIGFQLVSGVREFSVDF